MEEIEDESKETNDGCIYCKHFGQDKNNWDNCNHPDNTYLYVKSSTDKRNDMYKKRYEHYELNRG